MSSYRRFIPRDEWATSALTVAEVAEVAEVEANQGNPAAEALLKPAEVPFEALQLQQPSAEVQQRQRRRNRELQQDQQLQQASDPLISQACATDACFPLQASTQRPHRGAPLSGVAAEWRDRVLQLSTMPPPRSYPGQAWQQLIADAERFLDDWAAQAAALGWPAWELFGCHRRAPWGRIQGMGVVLLLRGDEIAALTETEAVIRTQTGACQTFRRKPRDPLHPAERCLVWELGR